MKNKKAIAVVIVLSIILNFNGLGSGVQAESEFHKQTKSKVSRELKDVTKAVKYDKGITKAKEWKKNKEKRYEYPIDYKDNIWKQYKDHVQMVKACNVPDDILKSADTEEILNLVLDYPLLCDIFAYNSTEEGMIALASQFNAFGELLIRSDISQTVFVRYLEAEIEDASTNLEENFDKVSEIVVLESLLAQNQIVDGLSDEEQDVLSDKVEENVIKKENTSLFQENETTFYEISDRNGVSEKINLKKYNNLNKSKMVNASSSLYVKTPNGTKVEVIKNAYKGSSWAASIDKQYKAAYPLATFLASSDNRYNCHSYAWHSASTSNRYWMNSPKAYVSDKSYTYVGQKATAASQKVVYKMQAVPLDDWLHSGIAVNTSGTIKSKWGQAPLVKHALNYCPYYGSYNAVHVYKRK